MSLGRMPNNLPERLEWAKQVIDMESEPSDLVIAAHTALAALVKNEFIIAEKENELRRLRYRIKHGAWPPAAVPNAEITGG